MLVLVVVLVLVLVVVDVDVDVDVGLGGADEDVVTFDSSDLVDSGASASTSWVVTVPRTRSVVASCGPSVPQAVAAMQAAMMRAVRRWG